MSRNVTINMKEPCMELPIPKTLDIQDGSSVTHRVLSTLRHEIVTAQLEPGEIIREAEIAARLGVSKTPVREALHTLLSEDFVMLFPRRGYAVRPVGLKDIRDIMDLRLSIEPPITGVAARRSTSVLVGKLEELLRRQSDESVEHTERLNAANDFHRTIAATARNERAEKLLNIYFDETTRMHYLFEEVHEHVVSHEELSSHRAILDAIASKDEGLAKKEMVAHLQESNEAILRSFH